MLWNELRRKRYAEDLADRQRRLALGVAYQRKYRYGLSPQEYYALVARQGGACAICRKIKPLCVDHCHLTGRVRGLLCRTCNSAIGFWGDSPAMVRRALKYLETAGGDARAGRSGAARNPNRLGSRKTRAAERRRAQCVEAHFAKEVICGSALRHDWPRTLLSGLPQTPCCTKPCRNAQFGSANWDMLTFRRARGITGPRMQGRETWGNSLPHGAAIRSAPSFWVQPRPCSPRPAPPRSRPPTSIPRSRSRSSCRSRPADRPISWRACSGRR